MILKPQKINQQKINVFFLVKNHRNYLLCGIILQNLSKMLRGTGNPFIHDKYDLQPKYGNLYPAYFPEHLSEK
jgi:hypothetical protein